MNRIMDFYTRVLRLYPRRFHEEFADEMRVVFEDLIREAEGAGPWRLARLCLWEFAGLPFSILREHRHEKGGTDMDLTPDLAAGAQGAAPSQWDKWIAPMPFLLFGLVCILGKYTQDNVFQWFGAYLFALAGLVLGGIRGFPRWPYSFLGWAGVFSWLWSMMPVDTLIGGSASVPRQVLGFLSFVPLLAAFGLICLWRRSFRPFRELARGIWNDWTLLSLAMYSFFGYVNLIYDENHHPYLILFMLASTIVICGAVWLFMSSRSTVQRILSLLGGFALAWLFSWICNNTWDWNAYYGLPAGTPEAWYTGLAREGVMLTIWTAILFWPALLALGRRPIKPPPPARA